MVFTPDIEWVAVVVAAALYFVLGWLWYGPLFGKLWAKEMGMPRDAKPTPAQLGRGLGLSALGALLLAVVFAHVLEAFTERAWDPAGAERTVGMAIQGAAWTWLGFFLPVQLGTVAWEGRSWNLAGINLAYQLVGLVVVALALTAWP